MKNLWILLSLLVRSHFECVWIQRNQKVYQRSFWRINFICFIENVQQQLNSSRQTFKHFSIFSFSIGSNNYFHCFAPFIRQYTFYFFLKSDRSNKFNILFHLGVYDTSEVIRCRFKAAFKIQWIHIANIRFKNIVSMKY